MNQELLLISIYCMVDDFCAQPQVALQLCRPGRKPKLSDVSLLSLSLCGGTQSTTALAVGE